MAKMNPDGSVVLAVVPVWSWVGKVKVEYSLSLKKWKDYRRPY